MATDSRQELNLVFGASGYIGTNLTEYLMAEGFRVRATSRRLEVLEGRAWQDIELCRADALEPETLDRCLAGVDVAYYLVHSMAAGNAFPELDALAARNFAAAAERQGIRRIIYLGGLTPEKPRSAHLRSRRETGDILREGTVPVTEIRAGMIIGPGSAAWEVIRDLVNHLPMMITPRWVSSRSTPIALSNLLRYLAEVPRLAETAGQTYEVAGPDVLTYVEIMRRYGAMVGRRPVIIPVPVLTPRLSSYWLRLVTSVPTNIARALIDGLSQDFIASDSRLEELVPQKLLGFDQAVREALEAERKHDIPARWVDSAFAFGWLKRDYGYYAKQAGGGTTTRASGADIWAVMCRLGNKGDFFFAPYLWWVRRAIDWLLGGPSFRRQRRHPQELRVGDVIDAWRVVGLEPGERLTLLMEMRAAGSGVMEFTIDDRDDERQIAVHAYWHPAGVWGLLYWYSTLPFHSFLFRGMVREIARRSEVGAFRAPGNDPGSKAGDL